MKPEIGPRGDQREIVLPGDLRPSERAGPRRPARPRRAGQVPPGEMRAAFAAVLGWLGRTCLARPGETAGTVIALGAVAYVSANALGFQVGRHPAPILPQPTPMLVKAAPARPDALAAVKSVEENAATEPAAPRKLEPRQAERTDAHDAIGDILRAEDATASVTPKPDKGVMRAQRALAKLGYASVKPDGLMGPATRAAIETFERERKLPVTGEAGGRTLRELSARASAAKGLTRADKG